MNFSAQISRLRKELGWSVKKAVLEINSRLPAGEGISLKTLYSWEYGTTEPKFSYGIALCRAYGVDDILNLFKSEENYCSALNTEGKKRLSEYRLLLLSSGKFTQAQAEDKENNCTRFLPLYDIAASAGTGQFLDSDAYTSVEVPDSVPLSVNFGIRIAGNSMEPQINDGDTVWVKRCQTIEHGETGVFYLNGDVLCKQLLKTDKGLFLHSVNKAYPPIELTEDIELRIFGKVVG